MDIFRLAEEGTIRFLWICATNPAETLGVQDGEAVDVVTRRGRVRAPARISGIRPGVVFVPFHYGYRDAAGGAPHRAANELTPTTVDPCSKQPIFKAAACRIERPAR